MRMRSACLLGSALALVSMSAEAADLALKRVMLSTGGVGYFEYEAQADGDTRFELPVRLDQMDDVLKSIVVMDDKGGSGAVEAPGRQPLSEIFRGLSVGQNDLSDPATLLNALKGAVVEVSGSIRAQGRIIAVTEELTAAGGEATQTRHRLSILTASGVQSAVLEELDSVTFVEPGLQAELNRALESMARHREQNSRTLTVTARGQGPRTVRVGFVAEVPLWKASYRLTQTAPDKARMQGWAVIENVSGADWRDVELTLVSGNPVTFRQALYTSYFVQRPEVPVEVLGRVLPPADEGAVAMDALAKAAPGGGAARAMAPVPAMAPPPPPPAPEPQAMEEMTVTGSVIPAPDYAAQSEQTATAVTFTLPQRVSVGAGQSLAVPIVDREAPALPVALYQPSVSARHPLMAVRLVNDSGVGLPPGVLTLYDAAKGPVTYSGDARLATLPNGETRMLSFAVDDRTTVDREDRSMRQIVRARMANGVLEIVTANKQVTSYTVKAPADADRALVIEHPRWRDWTLTAPAQDGVETTDDALRIPYAVKAGETGKLNVVLERTETETRMLVDLDASSIAAFLEAGETTPEQKDAFRRMAELRGEMDRQQAVIEQASAERDRLFEEQKRLRENLGAVPQGSDLARRYLDALNRQEDQAEGLAQRIRDAEAARDAKRQELAAFVSGLTL